jgi:hypothetical protein
MSKKLELPTTSIHMQIFTEDKVFLEEWCRLHQAIGLGEALRRIVHSRVKALRTKQIEALDAAPAAEAEANAKIARLSHVG